MIDQELRAPLEEVGERGLPDVGVEAIGLVDANPGQRLALAGDLVASVRELLLGDEQLAA
jgi:hypothetical protein